MKEKTTPAIKKTIFLQPLLRPALPVVLGCKDYAQEEEMLLRMDRVLKTSGAEKLFVEISLEEYEANMQKMAEAGEQVEISESTLQRYCQHSEQALRCTVLKNLMGKSYRGMSKVLAQCALFRWFCRIEEFGVIQVPGKSRLQDYAHWLPQEKMERVLRVLSLAVADEEKAREIGLEAELDMEATWVDTTCLKANIHFPVDWVLIGDVVRTLVKAILTIRRHGLRRRIAEPTVFLRKINTLSIEMSAAARRKAGGKKERKRIVRAMKKLCKGVERHAKRYRQILDEDWRQTDLSRKEAEVILRRMDNVLRQLPQVMKQAHERIIGERKVANADKILSLYESDLHVIVRGKAGADIEFGNSLFIAETANGFILDHQLRREASPGDSKWLMERYSHIQEKSGGRLCAVVGDRNFESQATRNMLEKEEAFNGLCPKDPKEMKQRFENDEAFRGFQRRRSQTESRISILKNVFLEGIPRAKGFENRCLQVTWAVLAHNLWVVARCPWAVQESEKLLAA